MLASLDETLEPTRNVCRLITHGNEWRHRGRIPSNGAIGHGQVRMHAV
jgi:hypothetical protein